MKKSDRDKLLRGILWALAVIAMILLAWGIIKTFI